MSWGRGFTIRRTPPLRSGTFSARSIAAAYVAHPLHVNFGPRDAGLWKVRTIESTRYAL
jgi:hypothetical protein